MQKYKKREQGQPPIQRKVNTVSSAVPSTDHLTIPSGGGKALPKKLGLQMKKEFNFDFSKVRVYADGQAQSINAKAYTQGNNIHFADGMYRPNTVAGSTLIRHELSHVKQQHSGKVKKKYAHSLINDDKQLERQADNIQMNASNQFISNMSTKNNSSIIQRKVLFYSGGSFNYVNLSKQTAFKKLGQEIRGMAERLITLSAEYDEKFTHYKQFISYISDKSNQTKIWQFIETHEDQSEEITSGRILLAPKKKHRSISKLQSSSNKNHNTVEFDDFSTPSRKQIIRLHASSSHSPISFDDMMSSPIISPYKSLSSSRISLHDVSSPTLSPYKSSSSSRISLYDVSSSILSPYKSSSSSQHSIYDVSSPIFTPYTSTPSVNLSQSEISAIEKLHTKTASNQGKPRKAWQKGRIAFETELTTSMPVKKGHHRRHVIPQNLIIKAVTSFFAHAGTPSNLKNNELKKWVADFGGRTWSHMKRADMISEILKRLNSNRANLFPGDGGENTSIGFLAKQLEPILKGIYSKRGKQDDDDIVTWAKGKLKKLNVWFGFAKKHTKAVKTVINQAINEPLSLSELESLIIDLQISLHVDLMKESKPEFTEEVLYLAEQFRKTANYGIGDISLHDIAIRFLALSQER